MTKQFTTPCYVRIENKGKRKKVCEQLHSVGYKIKVDYTEDINPIVVASKLGILYDASQFEDVPGFIDCGINIPIFLALTAMNDSDDKDQLCIVNAPIFMFNKLKGIVEPENKKRYQVKGNFFKCLVPYKGSIKGQFIGYANPIIRKATVPEIIEHFKTEEK